MLPLVPSKILLLSYLLLISSLLISDGLYNRWALLVMGISYLLFVMAMIGHRKQGALRLDNLSNSYLAGAVAISIIYWFLKPINTDSMPPWFLNLANWTAAIGLIGLVVLYLLSRQLGRYRAPLFFILAIIPIMLLFFIPPAIPRPSIDVFYWHQTGAYNFIRGINPYSQTIGVPTHYTKSVAYDYPPGILYLMAPAYYIFGDIRYSQAFLLIITAIIIYFIARHSLGVLPGELLVLLFVYHPRNIFVLAHSFTDVFLVAPISLFVWLKLHNRWPALTAATLGFTIMLRQYLIFIPVQWLLIERRGKYYMVAAITALAVVLPFISSDLKGLVQNGFLFNLQGPFRPDSLTVSSFIFELFGKKASLTWSILVGIISALFTFFLFKKDANLENFMLAITFTIFSIIFLGKQAFGGYYYFVSIMMLLVLAIYNQAGSRPAQ